MEHIQRTSGGWKPGIQCPLHTLPLRHTTSSTPLWGAEPWRSAVPPEISVARAAAATQTWPPHLWRARAWRKIPRETEKGVMGEVSALKSSNRRKQAAGGQFRSMARSQHEKSKAEYQRPLIVQCSGVGSIPRKEPLYQWVAGAHSHHPTVQGTQKAMVVPNTSGFAERHVSSSHVSRASS